MKAALIGLGMVADTHIAALRDNRAGVTLKGVLARDPSKAQKRAQSAGADLGYPIEAYASAEDIASDAEVDFVILVTPPNARHAIVSALAGASKPILMEKPVERDLEKATQIVTLCEQEGIPLGIVFQHRMRQASVALAQAIDDGVLGNIITADIRVPWWRDQAYYDAPGRGSYERDGGGVMISQAIHTLDLALSVLGPVTELSAQMQTTVLHDLEAEDWAAALLTFERGAVGTLTATTASFPGEPESLTLQGSLAKAHLSAGVLHLTFMDGRVETIGETAATGGGADPMAFTHDWHQSILEDFAQAIKEGRNPVATGRQALGSHAVIDAMERSAKSGAKVKVDMS